jgi:hypothetical protein
MDVLPWYEVRLSHFMENELVPGLHQTESVRSQLRRVIANNLMYTVNSILPITVLLII